MVVLHFGRLYKRAERTRAAVRGSLLEVCVTALNISAQQLRGPFRFLEIFQRRVDVVWQVAFCLAQVLDLRGVAIQAGLEDGVACTR